MAATYDIQYDWIRHCWHVVVDNKVIKNIDYISCNDAIREVERFDPKTAELLWLKYFTKGGEAARKEQP